MIPYEDLLNALIDWRARQGLPPLHNLDHLGEHQQGRIDTSTAIALVTGALEVGDLDEVGADYDDPLAPPPIAAPAGDGGWDAAASANDAWSEESVYEDPYDDGGAADSFATDGFPADGFAVEEHAADDFAIEEHAADGFDVEEFPAASETPPPAPAYDFGSGDGVSYDVGDSTAMFQELAPSAGYDPALGDPNAAAGYEPMPTDPNQALPMAGYEQPPASPYGLADNAEEATMMGGIPQPSGAGAPPPAMAPPTNQPTAIFDTSLVNAAAAAADPAYGAPAPGGATPGQPTAMFDTSLVSAAAAAADPAYAAGIDGGVPSEPVYDSMAAQAEYQAERLAEQQSEYGQGDGHTYVPGGLAGGYGNQPADYNYDQPADLQPPPLDPPPADDDPFAYAFPDGGDYGDESQ